MTPRTTQISRSNRAKQLSLAFPNTWGGKRKRAGRKAGPRPATPHRARAEHKIAHPVHVTMRAAFRPLRHRFVFPTLRDAIAAANRKNESDFRVVHFSVQSDHLHLVVEATDKSSLSTGMRSLAVRIAKRVNALVARQGKFWGDRWHGRELTTPSATRWVLRYVLTNFRKHRSDDTAIVDRYSSAPFFTGFRECAGRMPVESNGAQGAPKHSNRQRLAAVADASAAPRTWLLRVGWKKRGLLSLYDRPAVSPKSS